MPSMWSRPTGRSFSLRMLNQKNPAACAAGFRGRCGRTAPGRLGLR